VNLLAMIQGGVPQGTMDMILSGGLSTKIILGILAVFSVVGWVIIFWKANQFRRVRREGARFVSSLERSQRLEDAYKSVLRLPESPYTRLFRQGVNFFSELRPGSLKENAPLAPGLTEAQLHALRLVLEKEQGQESDELAAGVTWLAIMAAVSPLLGLLGTVLGVMSAFLGVAAAGTANISAIAPGVAEALITTVAGLTVAIPSAIASTDFARRHGAIDGELARF
jgi:biopolymer transport protein TolQ